MIDALLDSTITIDHLNGVPGSGAAIAMWRLPAVSIMTWMEVMAGAATVDQEDALRAYLGRFPLVGLSGAIANDAFRLRRDRRLKLPDAIILATARYLKVPLLTRNTKDFDATEPGIIVPYRI